MFGLFISTHFLAKGAMQDLQQEIGHPWRYRCGEHRLSRKSALHLLVDLISCRDVLRVHLAITSCRSI